MRFDILTLFPAMFDAYFDESIIKRAREAELIAIDVHNIRDYTTDKHHKADDTPYGGGAGMILKVEPIFKAVTALKESRIKNQESRGENSELPVTDYQLQKSRVILFSAKGKRFTQQDAWRLTQYDQLILICGRYEGVDERVAEYIADEELSLGDFVLTGGEIPALAVVDAMARLIPGVLGNEISPVTESHNEDGYLEYPQYTKPEDFQGWKVPEVLLSGNHAFIEQWRKEKAQEFSEGRIKNQE